MMLAAQFLRLQRTALCVWGGMLMLMLFSVTSATPAVTSGNGFAALVKSLGPGLQQMMGGDIARFASPVDGYITMKLLMVLAPIVSVYVVLAVGAVIAREQARGTAEFLLALPIERRLLLRQRFWGMATGVALLYIAIWICLVIGLEAVATPGSYDRYALALLADYGVNMATGGLVLILSVTLPQYAQTIRWGLVLALGAYLFVLAMQAGGILAPLRNLLLYGLANPFPIVGEGQLPWAAMLVGIAALWMGPLWAGKIFAHKELQ